MESSGTVTTDHRRHTVMLALKLLAGMVIIATPLLLAANWVPGFTAVAFFGVLAASFGWISGGVRDGVIVVASLALLGVVSIALHGHTWMLALILLLLGVGYGVAASRGVGKQFMQLPILTPYFMSKPPALFHDPPVIDVAYLFGIVVVMLVTGLWTVLVLRLAVPKHAPKRAPTTEPRIPLIYGTILGVISAVVMVLGTTTEIKTHWVWITLTLYVLADPQHFYSPAKMWGRVLGTFGGFALVSAIFLTRMPDHLYLYFALPALWLCLVFMLLKKPYWEYAILLTVAVVLMDTSGVNTLLLNAERIGFTLVGAGLSIAAAFLVNFIAYRRAGLRAAGGP